MKKRLTSIFCLFITILVIFPLAIPVTAAESETVGEEEGPLEPPEIVNIGTACVYNIENDRFIYEVDCDKVIAPASTVKLMTAIIAVEALGDDLSRPVTVPVEAILGVEGTRIGLKRDEILTVEQLLYALICGGANDAANVLAFETAGSIEAFVALMNQKAREIGAENTVYTNPTGMDDPGMVTTTRDVAIIAKYAYELQPICEMASVEKYIIDATNKAVKRTVFNKNYYFSTHMEYLYIWKVPRGLNAGYTPNGGSCVVTTGTRNGLTYIVVVMGATIDDKYIYSYTEAAKLLKWAFDAYGYADVLSTSRVICEVPVRLSGKVDHITLVPAENVELFLPKGIDVSRDVKITYKTNREYFVAPVSEGEVGGSITISYNGTELGTYDLVTRTTVSRNNFLYVLDLARDLTETRPFKVAATAAVIALIGYIGAIVFVNYRRYKRMR